MENRIKNIYYCRTLTKDDFESMETPQSFSGENDVDSFLCNDALNSNDENHHITTAVFRKKDISKAETTDALVAFYVLTVDSQPYNYEEDETLSDKEKEQLKSYSEEDLMTAVLNLRYLGVKKEEKGKGIGTYILEKISRIARRISVKSIFVEALNSAYPFYEKKGFDIISEESDIVQGSTMQMAKIINAYNI